MNNNKPIYAYKRKTIDGFYYGGTDIESLYNHSCVVLKKLLNKKEIKKLTEYKNKRIQLLKKEQEFLKEVLK